MSASETKEPIPEDACSEARRAQRRRDRKFDRRSNWRPALNLTSMIDVVFLLLVYFMVATEFKRAEVIERLDLPNRLGAGVADPFEVPDHPVVITVFSQDTNSGRSTVAAGFTIGIEGPFPQPTTLESLTDLLSERRMGGLGDAGFGLMALRLFSSPRQEPIGNMVRTFDAAARAGYNNISLNPNAG